MKNILKQINYITKIIRSLVIFVAAFNATIAIAQDQGSATQKSAAQTVVVCGTYPSAASFVQGESFLSTDKSCSTIITPGSKTVYFNAKNKIALLPGFTAEKGSHFVAYIKPDSAIARELLQQSINNSNNVSGVISQGNFNQLVYISPNPFRNIFTLMINSNKNDRVQVNIYNSVGVRVKQQNDVNILKGTNTVSFNLSGFSAGIYVIEVNLNDSKIIKKIVKN